MAEAASPQSQKVDRILKAAYQVFADKGFHEARIEEIADLAGIAKGTVYLYFPSKQDLYLAMLDGIFSRYVAAVTASAGHDGPWVERLTGTIETLLAAAAKQASMAKLEINLPHPCEMQVKERLIRARQELHEILGAILKDARAEGALAGIEPDFAAISLLGAVQAILLEHNLTGRQLDPESSAGSLVTLFVEGARNGAAAQVC